MWQLVPVMHDEGACQTFVSRRHEVKTALLLVLSCLTSVHVFQDTFHVCVEFKSVLKFLNLKLKFCLSL